jgi:hypothetical protein
VATLRTASARFVRQNVTIPATLKSSNNRFLAENDPARKNEEGKDLIRAIFGKDAIAEDLIR